jgi:hypothetical protein
MPVSIVPGEAQHIPACVGALLNSELGRQYFTETGATRELTRGMAKGEVYVALNSEAVV